MFHSALNFLHNIYQGDLNAAKAVIHHIDPLKGNTGTGTPLPPTNNSLPTVYHPAQGLEGQFPYPITSQAPAFRPGALQYILGRPNIGINTSDFSGTNILTAPPPQTDQPLTNHGANFAWQYLPGSGPATGSGYGFMAAQPIHPIIPAMQNYMGYQ